MKYLSILQLNDDRCKRRFSSEKKHKMSNNKHTAGPSGCLNSCIFIPNVQPLRTPLRHNRRGTFWKTPASLEDMSPSRTGEVSFIRTAGPPAGRPSSWEASLGLQSFHFPATRALLSLDGVCLATVQCSHSGFGSNLDQLSSKH